MKEARPGLLRDSRIISCTRSEEIELNLKLPDIFVGLTKTEALTTPPKNYVQ